MQNDNAQDVAAVEERAKRLWERLVRSEADFNAVYQEAIMPRIHRHIEELRERLELLDAPVPCGEGWKVLEGGTELFYKQDISAIDCQQLFTPRWPINENAFVWWKGMFTGRYFFRPEESPVAAYGFEEKDGNLTISADSKFNNWIYLPSRHSYPTSYVLEFDYTTWQDMCETLQLCFDFESLASRLRMVLSHNKELRFEVVRDGMFLPAYERDRLWERLTVPFSLKLGEPSHVRLEVLEDVFQIFFDGKPIIAVRVKGHVPRPAHCAIIAWNGFEAQAVAMKLRIENLRVLVRDAR